MEAFKESGSIEYSSDVVMGLQFTAQRGLYEYKKDSPEYKKIKKKKEGNSYVIDIDHYKSPEHTPRKIELKILKNRNGITGESIDFDYDPRFNYFAETDAAESKPKYNLDFMTKPKTF